MCRKNDTIIRILSKCLEKVELKRSMKVQLRLVDQQEARTSDK
jgi:hypothetical protein